METGAIVLAVVVAFFGLGSAVLGFIAEATKLTKYHIEMSWTQCLYPATPAFAMGIAAALLLLVAQIIVSAVTGCSKPRGGDSSGSKRTIGVVLSVLSWISAVVAEFFYVHGVLWIAPVTRETTESRRCYYTKDCVFRRAAFLSITATVLGIKSYFMLSAATAVPGGELKPDGVAMGLPVAPAYGYYPPPTPAHGYAHFPPPRAQEYAQFPPAAPAQQHARACGCTYGSTGNGVGKA